MTAASAPPTCTPTHTQIDLVIVATSSPDDLFGDAPAVAAAIGAKNAAAFDLTAACSGFLFALVTGSQFLNSGTYKNVLVIGADALSRWVDWSDRNVCILFGDGAGAVLLQAADSESEAGVLGFELHSNGMRYRHRRCLCHLYHLRRHISITQRRVVITTGTAIAIATATASHVLRPLRPRP